MPTFVDIVVAYLELHTQQEYGSAVACRWRSVTPPLLCLASPTQPNPRTNGLRHYHAYRMLPLLNLSCSLHAIRISLPDTAVAVSNASCLADNRTQLGTNFTTTAECGSAAASTDYCGPYIMWANGYASSWGCYCCHLGASIQYHAVWSIYSVDDYSECLHALVTAIGHVHVHAFNSLHCISSPSSVHGQCARHPAT